MIEPNKTQENEANYFARCLLMPETWIKQDVETMGGIDQGSDDITALASRYQVPISAMATRLAELKLLS